MVRLFAMALSTVLWMLSAQAAFGYEVVEVRDGGTLKGTVYLKGSAPSDETIVIDRDVECCGEKQKLGKYVISDARVKNVVVWIDNIGKGKAPPPKPVEVTIRRCKAVPHVSVGYVGGTYVFRNDDDILHTIQLKLGLAYQQKVSGRPLANGATIYNLAFPIQGLRIEKPIKAFHRYSEETGFIQIRSNAHNWISGYIFIFDHPYAAVTDEQGSFVLKDLPPGEYVLKVWHEGLGMMEKAVKVAGGEVTEVEVAFSG